MYEGKERVYCEVVDKEELRTVGTGYENKKTKSDNNGTAEALLKARFNEVMRQFIVADPSVDTSRIKQKNEDNSKIAFKGKVISTSKPK